MARIPYVDPEQASPEVREALEQVPPLNIFRMLANADSAFRPLLQTGAALLGDAELDDRLRELAILHVARLSGAEYEWIQHVEIGKAVGVTDEQLTALDRGETAAPCFDDIDRLVLRFTSEVVQDVAAAQETFAQASDAFSPREIVELVLTIGFYMMLGRVMETTGIDLDEPIGTAVVDGIRRGGSSERS